MAPSRAIGKLTPRPRKMKFCASTFWQPMSHKMHSPRFKGVSQRCIFCVCHNGLDSRSRTACTWSGNSSMFCSNVSRSACSIVPQASPNMTARRTKARQLAQNAFVDATPASSPAIASITTSLSRAIVEFVWFTTATTRTFAPLLLRLTSLMLSTASMVSPELETTMNTSPSFMIGVLHLNSDAYCTSTGILAIVSTRYSAKSEA
mmetsp:Transcript_59381/g.165813  ORF Transcript_59381/g.165813 Transcript_59381/m.165813 type:complete len:205 (-) Transcript_59381:366-980(-)